MKKRLVSGLLYVGLVSVAIAIPEKTNKKKKGTVVDLGTLNIEGEARQPNLQYIEGPAVKDKILKKVFNNSVRNIETELLSPATEAEFPELKKGK